MNRRLILMMSLGVMSAALSGTILFPAALLPAANAQPAGEDSVHPTQAPDVAYATRDAAGVWSFSDIPDPTARTIALPQSESISLSSEELIAQMLDVAATLETARLARADRRATRSAGPARAAQQSPAVVTEQRIYSPYFPYSPHGDPRQRHHRRSQGTPEPASQPPERKKGKIRFPIDF